MTKKKLTRKAKENIMLIMWGVLMGVLLMGMLSIVFDTYEERQLKQELQTCQEDVFCDDSFEEMMSDSCIIGCIYSTKFYCNNVDFGESSFDCMLNCLEKAEEIQSRFSFCEVIK